MLEDDPTAARRVSQLLLTAVDGLPAPDRAEVLAYLFERALAPGGTARQGRVRLLEVGDMQLDFTLPVGSLPGGRGQRAFPVRLPERDHARLKDWCDRHGFSMAVVVRGLVERFLDTQEPREPTPPE